jgi:hypothetical protein
VEAADPAGRPTWLRKAVEQVEQARAIFEEDRNEVNAAASHYQLGVLYLDLGDLEQAERHALAGLSVSEGMGAPDVWKDYRLMGRIARARGDSSAAEQWEAKYQAAHDKAQRLARGEDAPEAAKAREAQGKQVFNMFYTLAQYCYQARESAAALDPQAAEALARIAQNGPPWDAAAEFLLAYAEKRSLPGVPADLPKEIKSLLEGLRDM